MKIKAGRNIALAWIASLFLCVVTAQAVSLGKIEVTSFLGEPFHALVPVKLDAGESMSGVAVEVAKPSDYRIFEVYRDEALSLIRSDVVSDKSGVRVELSSSAALKAPFFNLILKTQQGRVTHFKKYPVFLEQPKPITRKAPVRKIVAAESQQQTATVAVEDVKQPLAQAAGKVERFDGWARTGRYGPIVRGDTLYTVAGRLRTDSRYTRKQVMVALFEKNRDKFNNDNINLLKAGSYLDTPKAVEVERISGSQAAEIYEQHQKQWRELTRQPRYAAELQAQKTRYSKKISIGEQLDGVAAAPVAVSAADDGSRQDAAKAEKRAVVETQKPATKAEAAAEAVAETASTKEAEQAVSAESIQLIASLREENSSLQKQLNDSKKHIEALSRKIDNATQEAKAASEAAVAKLEVMVKQLQSELDQARRQAAPGADVQPDWLVSALGGLIVLLLGVILLLKRRENQPARIAPVQDGKVGQRLAPSVSEAEVAPEAEVDEPAVEPEQAEPKAEELPEDRFVEELAAQTASGEMEPFVASEDDQSDSIADYLQEADTYIRYGMDDEALQQVNHALRIRPDYVEAYIKKARILNARGDRQGFEENVATANSALAGADLERFAEALFDIMGVSEATGSNSAVEEGAAPAETDEPIETMEEDLQIDAVDDASSLPDDLVVSDSDARLTPGKNEQEAELSPAIDEDELFDVQTRSEIRLDEGEATLEFSNLLDEFADETPSEAAKAPSDSGEETPSADTETGDEEPEFKKYDADDGLSFDLEMDHGATQELQMMLNDFPEDEEEEAVQGDAQPVADEIVDDSEDVYELDISGDTTREFNELLSDFSEFDQDIPSASPPEEVGEDSVESLTSGDEETEELDDLLSKFSNDEEEEDKDK